MFFWRKGYKKGVEDAADGKEDKPKPNDKTWGNEDERRADSLEEAKYWQGYLEGQEDYHNGNADIE